ncbi:Scube1 [Symbiodinium sp. CCMP2592]|nr:Scube1 [Symbiodinium sp. CCMP2592]
MTGPSCCSFPSFPLFRSASRAGSSPSPTSKQSLGPRCQGSWIFWRCCSWRLASSSSLQLMAFTLAAVILAVFLYFAVHAVAQFLRDLSHRLGEEEEVPEGTDFARVLGRLQRPLRACKRFTVDYVVPLLQQDDDDEQFIVEWSCFHDKVVFNPPSANGRYFNPRCEYVWRMWKRTRAVVLRVGSSYQEQMMAKAFEGFVQMWVCQFHQRELPPVQTILCVLASTRAGVAEKIKPEELSSISIQQVQRFCDLSDPGGPQGLARFSLDEFGRALRRLGMMPAADAVGLVQEVCRLVEETRASKTGVYAAKASGEASSAEHLTDKDFCLEDLVEL